MQKLDLKALKTVSGGGGSSQGGIGLGISLGGLNIGLGIGGGNTQAGKSGR